MNLRLFLECFVLDSEFIRIHSEELTTDGDHWIYIGRTDELVECGRPYNAIKDRKVFYIEGNYEYDSLNIYIQ